MSQIKISDLIKEIKVYLQEIGDKKRDEIVKENFEEFSKKIN